MKGSFLLNICFLYFTTVLLCNSLTPKSGWLPISPHIVTPNISPPQYPNKGNDRQLKMLLTGQQIFLVRSIGNAWRTVWKICILMGCLNVGHQSFPAIPSLRGLDHMWSPVTPLTVWRISCFSVISQVITEIRAPWLVEDCVISRYNLLVWDDYCRGVFITNKAE